MGIKIQATFHPGDWSHFICQHLILLRTWLLADFLLSNLTITLSHFYHSFHSNSHEHISCLAQGIGAVIKVAFLSYKIFKPFYVFMTMRAVTCPELLSTKGLCQVLMHEMLLYYMREPRIHPIFQVFIHFISHPKFSILQMSPNQWILDTHSWIQLQMKLDEFFSSYLLHSSSCHC